MSQFIKANLNANETFQETFQTNVAFNEVILSHAGPQDIGIWTDNDDSETL